MYQIWSNGWIAHISQVVCWIEVSFESHWGSLRAALPSSCLFWQLTKPFASVSAHIEYLWKFVNIWIILNFCLPSLPQDMLHLPGVRPPPLHRGRSRFQCGQRSQAIAATWMFWSESQARDHRDRTQARVCAARLATCILSVLQEWRGFWLHAGFLRKTCVLANPNQNGPREYILFDASQVCLSCSKGGQRAAHRCKSPIHPNSDFS